MDTNAVLADWSRREFAARDLCHPVYERGDGRAVILLPELPGITPELVGLAEEIIAAGFRVTIPSLTGGDGKPFTTGRVMASMARLCVASEFRAFALQSARPFSSWLRALCDDVADRTASPSIGVIGLCFTGGFALAAAVNKRVGAAVVSQPTLPMPLTARHRSDVGLSLVEQTVVIDRVRSGSLCAMGLRFSEDKLSPKERFASLRRALGDSFEVIEIDSSPGNPEGISPRAHTLLTLEMREDGATRAARDRVIVFLRDRL